MLVGLLTWMTAEMKSRMTDTVPLKTGSSSHTIHHVAVESKCENKGNSQKCWICKIPAHWTNECQKCLVLNHKDSNNHRQENHACFSCLKRAGRHHKITTCSRRKQCTELQNGIQCKQYRHPLLHKKNVIYVKVSISCMTEYSQALLLVISASLYSLYKHANVLLDSGAQISLIRLDTTKILGLEGKSVSLTITKFSHQKKNWQQKSSEFKLPLWTTKKTFTVKAVVIFCFSNDVVDVKTKEIADGLGLKKIAEGLGLKVFTMVKDQSTL